MPTVMQLRLCWIKVFFFSEAQGIMAHPAVHFVARLEGTAILLTYSAGAFPMPRKFSEWNLLIWRLQTRQVLHSC